MMTRAIAQSLMSIVPGDTKGTATITLNPLFGTREVVTVEGCWLKPTDGGMGTYGQMEIEQDDTIVKVPDAGLNPNGEGREIHESDLIEIFGVQYVVSRNGANLRTVRTVWDCFVSKAPPAPTIP